MESDDKVSAARQRDAGGLQNRERLIDGAASHTATLLWVRSVMADLQSIEDVVELTAKELRAGADRLCSDFEQHQQVRGRRQR